MDNCIFCKIVKKEIPSNIIWEDENFIAFPTINPFKRGHTLVIPKAHENYFFEMEDELMSQLTLKAKPIAAAIKKTFVPKSGKVAMLILGMGVPHVHLHLLPLDKETDFLDITKVYKASNEELTEVSNKIKENIS